MSLNYKSLLKLQMNSFKKSIPTVFSDSAVKCIYLILDSTYDELLNLSKQIPDQDHSKPLNPGRRSFRENIIHILNMEELNLMLLAQALIIDKPEVLKIHSERDIGKLKIFEPLSTKELLSYFKLRRKILLNLLQSLSREQWSRVIIEKNKTRQESVYWRTRTLALHEYEHIQIMNLQIK